MKPADLLELRLQDKNNPDVSMILEVEDGVLNVYRETRTVTGPTVIDPNTTEKEIKITKVFVSQIL